jgi:hypothetical protein
VATVNDATAPSTIPKNGWSPIREVGSLDRKITHVGR